MTILPDNILRWMNPEDRKSLGKQGRTHEEINLQNLDKSEKALQHQIRGYLRIREIEVLSPRMDRRSTIAVGWPDLTFAYNGIPCAWEVKTQEGKVREDQKQMHEKLKANGWRVAVVRSVEDAKKELDGLNPFSFSHPSPVTGSSVSP